MTYRVSSTPTITRTLRAISRAGESEAGMPTLSIRGRPPPSLGARSARRGHAGLLEERHQVGDVGPAKLSTAGDAATGEAVVQLVVGGAVRRVALDRRQRHGAGPLAGAA